MKIKIKPLYLIIADFILMLLLLLGPSLLKPAYLNLKWSLLLFIIMWPIASYILGKYKTNKLSIKNELLSIFMSGIVFWGIISLYVIVFQYYGRSYSNLMETIALVVLVNFVFRIIYYLFNRKKYLHHKTSFISSLGLRQKNWTSTVFNLLFVILAFMIIISLKPATLRIYLPQYIPFLLIYLAWEFIINLISKKSNFKSKNTYYEFIKPVIFTNAFNFLVLGLIVYITQLFSLSRLIIFGTVGLSTFFQLFFISIYYLHIKMANNVDESERLFYITPSDALPARSDDIALTEVPDLEKLSESVTDHLSQNVLSDKTELYDFISSTVNLKGIRESQSLILDTKTIFNLQTHTDSPLSLFINLENINNITQLNKYLATMNACMKEGGYVIGCGKVIRHIREKYINDHNKIIGSLLLAGNFIFRRVLPKLPVFREIDYFFTKGKNRTISQTEILGRLVYSGFKIIDSKDINGKLYFIAAKVNIPYEKGNPSYGLFISLNRIGKNGKNIKIYKFRTMHPYAEYIQDYVYEMNDLAKGGKLKDDYRITNWGRFFRKLWIDELPQFINLFKGDIKLVGIRALSPHYFALYPKEFQEYRKKFKPGILPPFYVDLPETMDEIVASEKKYLESYSKYKILTDIKYFWLISYNIVFKGKRSA